MVQACQQSTGMVGAATKTSALTHCSKDCCDTQQLAAAATLFYTQPLSCFTADVTLPPSAPPPDHVHLAHTHMCLLPF